MGQKEPEYLVSPASQIFSQVLFAHPASGNSATFLSEALELAESGVQSYLLGFQFKRNQDDPANFKDPKREATFRRACLEKVRGAADYLGSLTSGKAMQLTYVGKNFGAFIGGMIAGFDSRFSKFILSAGLPDLTEYYVSSDHEVARRARKGISATEIETYQAVTGSLNPTRHLKQDSSGFFYFQFGDNDDWIPKEVSDRYLASAPPNSRVDYYQDGHELHDEFARKDRQQFILQ